MGLKENNIPKAEKKIIGFGNIYMSDDGIGLEVIDKLENKIEGIELIDGGTSATDLILHAKSSKKIIIIDAVDAGQKTGEIIKFDARNVSQYFGNIRSFSLHDFNLSQALEMIQNLKINTEIVIIGIKPKNIGFGEKLSPEIEAKIPEIIDMVIREAND